MADEYRGKFPPPGKGVPSKEELLKPLIFPNHQRAFKAFNYFVAFGIAFYCIFYVDWPQEEHCFQPIREFVKEQKEHFFRLTPENQVEITKKVEELQLFEETKKDN